MRTIIKAILVLFVLLISINAHATLNFDLGTYTEYTGEFTGGVLSGNSQTVTGLSSRELRYYTSKWQPTGDLDVNGKLNYSVASNPTGFAPILFTNGIGTLQDIFADGPYLGVYISNSTGTPSILLVAKSSDEVSVSGAGYTLSLSTDIYYTLKKTGATATLKLYSDFARETLLSTQSLTLFASNDTYSHTEVGITSVNAATGGLITGTMSEVADNTAFYDLTVNITGSPDARWTATDQDSAVFGPFASGTQSLLTGIYDITFNDSDGYSAKPADITDLFLNGDTPAQTPAYTPYPTDEIWVRPLGGSYGLEDGTSYANAFDGFDNINQTILGPDATINIRGTHKETFIPTRSNLYLYGDIDGDDPGIFDGAVTVETTWTLHSGNIYKTEVGNPNVDYLQETEPTTPSIGERWMHEAVSVSGQLGSVGFIARAWTGTEWKRDHDWFIKPGKVWLDDNSVSMSTYPSTGREIDISGVRDYAHITESGLGGQVDDYWKGATVIPKFFAWVYEERVITSSSGDVINFTPLDLQFIGQSFFYIENIIGECTSHGQWAYHDGYLYMYLDTAPSNYTIEYSGLNHGVFSYGHSSIDIDELTFIRTNDSPILNWEGDIPTVTNNELRDFSVRGRIPFDSASISVHATDPFNYVRSTVMSAIYTGVTRYSNLTIEDNTIMQINQGDGIQAWLFTSGSIKRNKIGNLGYSRKSRVNEKGRPAGIVSFGNDYMNIEYNIAADLAYTGIQLYSNNGTCNYNVLGTPMNNHSDGAAIHTYGTLCYENEIAYNTINDVRSTDDMDINQFIAALYTDEYSHDQAIHDNKVYKMDTQYIIYGIHQNNTTNTPPNAFTDNLFYEDDTMILFNNSGDATNGVETGTLQLAESTYPTHTLTVNYAGWWSTDGGVTQQVSGVPYDYIDGAYLITFEDIGVDTPEDDVITVVDNTVIFPIPTVTILLPTIDPTYETSESSVNLSGTSSIISGLLLPGTVDLVEWDVDTGGSGTCTGTTTWSQSNIPLVSGDNVITITATSNQGKISTDVLTVTLTPPTETVTLDSNWPVGAEIVVSGVTYTEDTIIELEEGDYTAVPNDVAGYTNDGTQNFTVAIGTPQTVTITYTLVSSVTITGGGWAYKGTTYNSGDTVNLDPGENNITISGGGSGNYGSGKWGQ